MIKVLIVDDSPVMRKILCKVLFDSSKFELECAADPYEARAIIKKFNPDVITLDIEMPKMDGITFLKNLMKLNPLPVVMLSTLTQKGTEATLAALELGAVEYIAKPKADSTNNDLSAFEKDLKSKIFIAAQSYNVIRKKRKLSAYVKPYHAEKLSNASLKENVIAIGASTGGIEAIKLLLSGISIELPPIIITQHVPSFFSKKFAERLNSCLDLTVMQATHGMVLESGCVYIAPGGEHLRLKQYKGQLKCALDTEDKVNMHRPSVDVMFDSLSFLPAKNVLLILLTGMGKDGSQAMKKLVDQGAASIVQDEKTSIIWGMPGSAVKLGCADKVLPLFEIAQHLEQHFQK